MAAAIAVIVAVLLAGLLVFAATKPDTFRVQRATRIDAPPETIFALIEDFHRWSSWSPWEHRDPAMRRIHSGAEKGRGAVYAWEGNRQVGQGRMEIAQASPPSKVTISLDFIKPFPARNVTEFILEPTAGSTNVTWAMHGSSPYMAKLMQVFFSMDRMVGRDFEAGLANLKAAAER
jgi:uncharacterized protein YndB with AHSA1/START domain